MAAMSVILFALHTTTMVAKQVTMAAPLRNHPKSFSTLLRCALQHNGCTHRPRAHTKVARMGTAPPSIMNDSNGVKRAPAVNRERAKIRPVCQRFLRENPSSCSIFYFHLKQKILFCLFFEFHYYSISWKNASMTIFKNFFNNCLWFWQAQRKRFI